MRTYIACVLLAAGGISQTLAAATLLFDFESPAELQRRHYEGKPAAVPVKEVSFDQAFATSGAMSLRFSTPKWVKGKPRWPAFELDPPTADWRGFDRLVFDVTNATPDSHVFNLFVTDSKVATRSGLSHHLRLAPYGFTRGVVRLSAFAGQHVNPADIRKIHLYTADAPGDMVIYLDRLMLLRPGEPLPAVPDTYLRQLAELRQAEVGRLRNAVGQARGALEKTVADSPSIRSWMQRELAVLDGRIEDFAGSVDAADHRLLDSGNIEDDVRGVLRRLETLVPLRLAFETVRASLEPPAADGSPGVVIGFASSMVKVLPRSDSLDLDVRAEAALSVARNESESLQLVVVPCGGRLSGVAVRVQGLRDEAGNALPADNIKAVPVGYVRTDHVPPYGSSHVGWWPDPILEFMSTVDIEKGDAQSFWVRVTAPPGQAAGLYRGRLEVVVAGQTLCGLPLTIRIRDFTLPSASPLPLAITFAPHDHPTADSKAAQWEWRKSAAYPINAWRQHLSAWVDFLADYYITYDSLYRYQGWQPAFDQLKRLHDQGRLGRFNLGYFGPCGEDAAKAQAWEETTLVPLREAYGKAKELGILDHAYIYGCDEAKPDLFPTVQRAAARLKQEFPEVTVMTTTYDHSYGRKSVIKAVDAWCPLTPRFDAAKAAAARQAGRQVWWYICCGPHHPHANMFVEYPAIEGRLLMGAMTAKNRPDGFLYYQISIWNSEHAIETGPFTTWNPRSWTSYDGDGSWTCVGPRGTPLPTIRLENFRDGLEDYAYFRILEQTVAKVEADEALRIAQSAWLKQAKAALAVPDELGRLTGFSRDPELVRQWRQALAEAIEAAPVPAAKL